jgi:zinc and cadmium transporter
MFLQVFFASIVGSVFALAGGVALLWREEFARRWSLTLVSFAAGNLMGAAFLELIPEAIGEGGYGAVAPFLLAGIIALFLFEKFLNWYHCHDQEMCDYHFFSSAVLAGDAIHNFIDGIVIALSFAVGFQVGVAATIAIFFHEVPQEIGDFGVLLHAGYEKSKVFSYNLLTALTTPAGAVAGFFLMPWISPYLAPLLAFAAGSFIYIAVSDLLPELKHGGRKGELIHLLSIALGILTIWLVGVAFPE